VPAEVDEPIESIRPRFGVYEHTGQRVCPRTRRAGIARLVDVCEI